MRKLLYAATVAGPCLLSASSVQAQCACDSGYYGYGPAYYGYAVLPPVSAYYGYAGPTYSAYYDEDVGWGGGYGYGVAAIGVPRGYYGYRPRVYGYGPRVGVGRIGYGYRAIGVGRVGWRGGYGYRAAGVGRIGIGARGFRR